MTWASRSFGKGYLITCSWHFGPDGSLQTSWDCEQFEGREDALFTCFFLYKHSARCNVGTNLVCEELTCLFLLFHSGLRRDQKTPKNPSCLSTHIRSNLLLIWTQIHISSELPAWSLTSWRNHTRQMVISVNPPDSPSPSMLPRRIPRCFLCSTRCPICLKNYFKPLLSPNLLSIYS